MQVRILFPWPNRLCKYNIIGWIYLFGDRAKAKKRNRWLEVTRERSGFVRRNTYKYLL